FQAEDGIRDYKVTGVQTCALPILAQSGTIEMPGSSSSNNRTADRTCGSSSASRTFTPWGRAFSLPGLPAVATASPDRAAVVGGRDRKSTRLNSSHLVISYAVFCLK